MLLMFTTKKVMVADVVLARIVRSIQRRGGSLQEAPIQGQFKFSIILYTICCTETEEEQPVHVRGFCFIKICMRCRQYNMVRWRVNCAVFTFLLRQEADRAGSPRKALVWMGVP